MGAQTIRFEAMVRSSPLDFAYQPGPRRGAGGALRQLVCSLTYFGSEHYPIQKPNFQLCLLEESDKYKIFVGSC